MTCRSEHPEHPATICLIEGKHSSHSAFSPEVGKPVRWPNESYVEPRRASEALAEVKGMIRAERAEARPVLPHVRSSTTSRSAAEAHVGKAGRGRVVVAQALSDHGLIDEEIAERTGLPPNTARPRRVELVEFGYVGPAVHVDGTPITRATVAHRQAQVWELTELGRSWLGSIGPSE